MHSAHPSSYSANTLIFSPIVMESSSGRVMTNVHTTVARKGDIFRGDWVVEGAPPAVDGYRVNEEVGEFVYGVVGLFMAIGGGVTFGMG
jgi:hypothetical protein